LFWEKDPKTMSSTDPLPKLKKQDQHGSYSQSQKRGEARILLPKQKTMSNTDPPPKTKIGEIRSAVRFFF
jgi:hypothetical protein